MNKHVKFVYMTLFKDKKGEEWFNAMSYIFWVSNEQKNY